MEFIYTQSITMDLGNVVGADAVQYEIFLLLQEGLA
jgi:hypothetical protein